MKDAESLGMVVIFELTQVNKYASASSSSKSPPSPLSKKIASFTEDVPNSFDSPSRSGDTARAGGARLLNV